jgi:hypothetical protein
LRRAAPPTTFNPETEGAVSAMSPFGLKELTGRVSGLYSDDQKRYLRSLGKCPRCDTRGTADLIDDEGTVLGKLELRKAVKPTGQPLFARCKHCEGTWDVFAEKTPALIAAEPTVEIVETEQTAEPFRVDTMCLDNRGGTSPLRRTVTKSQEWSRSYQISGEEASTSGKTLTVPLGAASLGLKAERALKNGYQLSEDKKAVLTDTFDFEVPANTFREVSFIYKQIWQHGLLRVVEDGETREAPFKVALRLEVDLAQNDRTS